MTTKLLRDCRGFVELINELCSCGGSDRANGCDACKIYHAIGDWLTVEAPKEAPPGKVVSLEGGGTAVLTMTTTEPTQDKRCGTCAALGHDVECETRYATMPDTGVYHCWAGKP